MGYALYLQLFIYDTELIFFISKPNICLSPPPQKIYMPDIPKGIIDNSICSGDETSAAPSCWSCHWLCLTVSFHASGRIHALIHLPS